jgi:hypothetical protein
MTAIAAFGWAFAGGLAVSILDYASLAGIAPAKRPATFSDPPYLAKFFGHPLIGGIVSAVFQQSTACFTPTLAFVAGAAAPSIVKTLVLSGAGLARAIFQDLPKSD